PAAQFGGTTASNIVTVTLNAAPWLSPILDRSTHGCVPLIITNVAVDPDIPPQALTYSLSRNPPPPLGAAIDSGSGVFTWRPTLFQVETTNSISVVVTDSGNPSLSATQSFKVTVNPVTPACFTALGWSNGLLQLVIVGQTGPDYTVQGSSDLTTWRTLLTTNSPSLPLLWRDVEAAHYRWRFYRVWPG